MLVCASTLRLVYCALAPPSYDLQDIATYQSSQIPVGPWTFLYIPLHVPSLSNDTLVAEWASAPPAASPYFMALSLTFRLLIFFFDIATMAAVYYLAKRLSTPEKAKLAALVWILNPFTLFAVEFLAVPDVAVTFLTVVAIYMLISNRGFLCGLFLGMGVFFKFFPILLLPICLLIAPSYGISRKSKVAILCCGLIGLIGYLSWVLPPEYTFENLATYYPVTQLLPFVGDSGSWINGPSIIMILFYCVFGILFKKSKGVIITGPLLLTLLAYYALTATNPYPNPYPQELVWALPFISLDTAFEGGSRALLLVFTYGLAFAQSFLSSSLITASGYTPFLIRIGGTRLGDFLQGNLVKELLLPLVSSALFAAFLIYAVEIVRTWYRPERST